jgi:hypothetical protein
MVGPAHRGFRRRFERLVDPDSMLDPLERSIRADRARRAHMLRLAELSAAARKRKAGSGAAETRKPAAETDGGSRRYPSEA